MKFVEFASALAIYCNLFIFYFFIAIAKHVASYMTETSY